MDQKLDQGLAGLEKKLSELELSTLWKIRDFERVVASRVNEDYVRDFFKAERANFTREYMDYFDQQLPRLEKKHLDADNKISGLQREIDKAIHKISVVNDDANRKLGDAMDTLRRQFDDQMKIARNIDERVRRIVDETLKTKLPGIDERVERLETEIVALY